MSNWITRTAFRAAVDALAERGIHSRTLIYLSMKYAGVNKVGFTEFQSARENRDGFFVPFLKVQDGTTPRYYMLFEKSVTPGGRSNYAHSSQYSPIKAGREQYIRDWVEWEGDSYKARFKENYEEGLKDVLLKDGRIESRIPLAALAIYLQAMQGSVEEVLTDAALTNQWKKRLNLDTAEVNALFDDQPWKGPVVFSQDAFTREDAAGVINSVIPPPVRTSPSGPLTSRTGGGDTSEAENLSGLVAEAQGSFTNQAHFRVSTEHVLRFVASLMSKRFAILTGLSGSGKTKIAQAFAQWITPRSGEGHKYYEVVAVGADWVGSDSVLGYPNGLDAGSYVSKPALDLIVHAGMHAAIPHFLILDEMNLSHVERYFADILSAIESGEHLQLHRDDHRQAHGTIVPGSIGLPENLFIVGTVNVDETTYMFSPKVLDRANVLEFRMTPGDLIGFLEHAAKPDLAQVAGLGYEAGYGESFVAAANDVSVIPTEVKREYDDELILFFQALQIHGAEFGYRTAYEAGRFIYFYKLLVDHAEGDVAWFTDAFDCVIVQKLLPKLHGSRAKLGPILKKLWFLCVSDTAARSDDPLKAADDAARSTDKKSEPILDIPDGAPYPLSAEKIARMWKLLMDNGFASFAEA